MWLVIAVVLIAGIGGGYLYLSMASLYVTPGGITLLRPPKHWHVRASTLTWDTQDQPRGEHIEFLAVENPPTNPVVPPYIFVNLGPETATLTGENYISDLKREIRSVGGEVMSERPITIAGATGYDLELTAVEDGMNLRSRVVVLNKEGMLYQITAVAQERYWAEHSKLFDKAIASLKLTR